jgi:hypothetical protein
MQATPAAAGSLRTPWPLLLTILNLPQLSIMISLQVSANRAQAASDARAMADHATLVALRSSTSRRWRSSMARTRCSTSSNARS